MMRFVAAGIDSAEKIQPSRAPKAVFLILIATISRLNRTPKYSYNARARNEDDTRVV